MNKLSVIVPVYNAENYLVRCLRSIIHQTYTELEIILVNDGSSDRSLEICKIFARNDERIVIIDKENGGVQSAIKSGLERATGSYVTFVDNDDFIDLAMHEEMIRVLETEEADVVECSYRRFNEQEFYGGQQFTDEVIVGEYNNTLSAVKQLNNFCVNWNKIYRRELFSDVIFSQFTLGEDYYFNVQIATKIKKKVTISSVFYNYYENKEGMVSESFSKKWFSDIVAAQAVYNYLRMHPEMSRMYEYSALDIVGKIVKQYVSIYKFHVENEDLEEYIELLRKTFEQYYNQIPKAVKKEMLSRKWYFALYFFQLNPALFGQFLKTVYSVKH